MNIMSFAPFFHFWMLYWEKPAMSILPSWKASTRVTGSEAKCHTRPKEKQKKYFGNKFTVFFCQFTLLESHGSGKWDLKNVSRMFFLLCIDDNVQIQIPGGQNRPNRGFWENQFWKNALLKKTPEMAKIALKLTLGGLKCTPEVRVPHKTCSTICRTHIQAILDQKKLTGLTFSLGAQVSKSKETIREFFEVSLYVPDTSGMNNWNYLLLFQMLYFSKQ